MWRGDKSYSRQYSEGGRLKRDNALKPILVLCALASLSSFGAGKFVPEYIHYFVIANMIIIGLAAVSYTYLLLADPNRLQSEGFQIERQSMEIMQEKGDSTPTVVDHSPGLDIPNIEGNSGAGGNA